MELGDFIVSAFELQKVVSRLCMVRWFRFEGGITVGIRQVEQWEILVRTVYRSVFEWVSKWLILICSGLSGKAILLACNRKKNLE